MPVDHAGTKPIPRPPRRHQLGLLRRLLQTPESVLDELDESYGPICGMGAGPLRVVVVGSPSLIHALLMQPNDRFRADTPLSPFPFVTRAAEACRRPNDDIRMFGRAFRPAIEDARSGRFL